MTWATTPVTWEGRGPVTLPFSFRGRARRWALYSAQLPLIGLANLGTVQHRYLGYPYIQFHNFHTIFINHLV